MPVRDPLPVGVVGVRYLNSRPLLAGLKAGLPVPFPYSFSTAEPSACADAIGSGSATAAVVPVGALPTLVGARALRTLGIACRGRATSVLLVTRVPPARIKRLAAHAASRTSVVLAQLLLAERWGARTELITTRPPLENMLEQADAAVVIGDPALSVSGRTGFEEIDLSLAWREWTGLPFVFAVWAIGSDAPAAIDGLLEASYRHAEEHWESLLPEWSAAHAQPVERVREYLGTTLHYRLDAEDVQAVREFLRRATGAGLLPANPASIASW